METITIKIKNKNKFRHFLAFIKDLEYIEILEKGTTPRGEDKISGDDFFTIAGMWKNREISAEDLRAKAWPKRR